MANRNKDQNGLAGGLGILAVAAYLCMKGLKKIDAHLKEKERK